MKTAIIGLPMTGKTSLFAILTGAHQETRMGSTAARTGVARVPDTRLEELGRLFEPPKVTHATVEYVDMPSISKESLRDPSYMASLRVADAFAHVLRLFEDDTVPHEKESVNPVRDLEDVETELILSDLVVIEKRLERLDKDRKKIKNPELDREFDLLVRAKAVLEDNQPLRQLELDAEDEKRIRGFQFLSQKPLLAVLNRAKTKPRGCTSANASFARDRWPTAATSPLRRFAAKSKPSWQSCRPRNSRPSWPATGCTNPAWSA